MINSQQISYKLKKSIIEIDIEIVYHIRQYLSKNDFTVISFMDF